MQTAALPPTCPTAPSPRWCGITNEAAGPSLPNQYSKKFRLILSSSHVPALLIPLFSGGRGARERFVQHSQISNCSRTSVHTALRTFQHPSLQKKKKETEGWVGCDSKMFSECFFFFYVLFCFVCECSGPSAHISTCLFVMLSRNYSGGDRLSSDTALSCGKYTSKCRQALCFHFC